jgi:hypothetical protein
MTGAIASPATWADPLKAARVALSATPSPWNAPVADVFARSKSAANLRTGSVASAVSPLDLRKLTMSDFGDVEARR